MNETEKEPLWDFTFVPTEDEIYTALRDGDLRRAGKVRLIVQSVLLVLVAAWCIAPVFFGGKPDYMLGGVAVAVCVAMWFVPSLKLRSDAKSAAAAQTAITVRVYENGLSFGADSTVVPFAEFTVRTGDSQLTLIREYELVPIPYRAADAACVAFLSEQMNETIREETVQ